MPEYFLRIFGSEIVTKRMVAGDHDTAIRAVLKWEGENPDMDLTCGPQRIAARRKSVWLLRPDANCEEDEDFAREARDKFTIAVGWAGSRRRMNDRVEMSRTARAQETLGEPKSPRQRPFAWLRRPR